MSELAVAGGTPIRRTPLPSNSNATGRDVGAEELTNLTEVIQSGKLFRYGGKFVEQCERDFAAKLGLNHAVAVSSGTAAVHTALGALNLDAGSEVITSPITDMGTIAPIIFQNCIPIFADLDPEFFTLAAESIEKCITDKTGAIIVVHLFGQPADMDAICAIGEKHGIPIIEDCAQAHMAQYNGRLVGTIGQLGCFSLQQSKQMTAGEGGLVVTNDSALAKRAGLFSDKGWNRADEPRDYLFLGTNYRMGELTGAVAVAQVGKVDKIVGNRRRSADLLTSKIKDTPGVIAGGERPGCRSSWWHYPLMIDESVIGCEPKQFARAVSAEGIPASHGYIGRPIYMSPFLQEKATYGRTQCPYSCERYGRQVSYKEDDCPNAVEILRRVITLPMNEFFTDADVQDIADAVVKVAAAYRTA